MRAPGRRFCSMAKTTVTSKLGQLPSRFKVTVALETECSLYEKVLGGTRSCLERDSAGSAAGLLVVVLRDMSM